MKNGGGNYSALVLVSRKNSVHLGQDIITTFQHAKTEKGDENQLFSLRVGQKK